MDLTNFLQVNKDNLIRLTTAVQPTLDVLAKYAPEYPCLMRQLAESVPRAELAFGKGTAHPEVSRVTIEFAASRGKYLPGVDEPKYEDKRGPRCYPSVPKPGVWPQYPPDGPIEDGSSKPAPPKSPSGETARPDHRGRRRDRRVRQHRRLGRRVRPDRAARVAGAGRAGRTRCPAGRACSSGRSTAGRRWSSK